MEKAIDLLILPPHSSHVLQPLDVGLFAPLKRAHGAETEAASRLDAGRIERAERTDMFIRARRGAITMANIKSGWRATGVAPVRLIGVLCRVEQPLELPYSDSGRYE